VLYSIFAFMLTDNLSKGIELLVAGRSRTAGRAFGQPVTDDAVGLPGVMSRQTRSPPSYWPRPRADLSRREPSYTAGGQRAGLRSVMAGMGVLVCRKPKK
jgi:hypothetical protein